MTMVKMSPDMFSCSYDQGKATETVDIKIQ